MSTSDTRQLADVLARLTRLEVEVAALKRGRGVRDRADAALLAALARCVGSRLFSARNLRAHAAVDPALAHALVAASLTSVAEIGCFLRRVHGIVIDGRVIRRDRRRWYVEHVDVRDASDGNLPPS